MGDINPNEMAILLYGSEEFVSRYRDIMQNFNKKLEDCIVQLTCKSFSNNELHAQIAQNIRRRNVYIIANFLGYAEGFDPNIGYMRLFIINDACRRASAAEINDILPYVPYLRQDRKDKPRVPISAKLFADLLERSGANRLVTVDMHVDQIQGFYNIPVDHFNALPLFAEEFLQATPQEDDRTLFQVDFFTVQAPIDPRQWVLVAPDAGAMKRARDLKTLIHRKYKADIDLAMLEKSRINGKAEVHYLVGNVQGKNAIIVDDIIDTAHTLEQGVTKLRNNGAEEIYVCGTHGLFSKGAEQRIRKAGIKVMVTDSIPRSREYLEANKDWLKMLSLRQLLVDGISRIQLGRSVSELFTDCDPSLEH